MSMISLNQGLEQIAFCVKKNNSLGYLTIWVPILKSFGVYQPYTHTIILNTASNSDQKLVKLAYLLAINRTWWNFKCWWKIFQFYRMRRIHWHRRLGRIFGSSSNEKPGKTIRRLDWVRSFICCRTGICWIPQKYP